MEWVTVQTCGLSEAEVLKNLLESYGIPARVTYDSFGRVLGMVSDFPGLTRVQVPQDREKEALEILEAPPAEE
ncbi:MAG: DUF2007 domain-containing protein [Candidatus Aminicenantales bacterium]